MRLHKVLSFLPKKKERTVKSNKFNIIQILIGLTGLLLGTFFYLTNRPPETYFVSFIDSSISLFHATPKIIGVIGNGFPTFTHVFSFILLTAGLISCGKRGWLVVCSSWFVFDCIFELGQKYNGIASTIIPDWFEGIPFLENCENYFRFGTFDMLDLASIALGTVAAYFILIITTNGGKHNENS